MWQHSDLLRLKPLLSIRKVMKNNKKDYFMKKILCFFGFHKWWFSGTLDGRLVMPRNGQIRVCQRCGKRQRYFTALLFGASDLGWQNVD